MAALSAAEKTCPSLARLKRKLKPLPLPVNLPASIHGEEVKLKE